MSFLQRTRSLGPNPFPSLSEDAPSASNPPVEDNHVTSRLHVMSYLTKGRKIPAGTIIRRVSTVLSKRLPKKPFSFAPLKVQVPPESRWKVINECSSPTESDISFDDIRRPSGLGRAVSISSNHSFPPSPFTAVNKDRPFDLITKNVHQRMRALSSPNSRWSTEALEGVPNNSRLQRPVSMIQRNKACPPPPMPHEVLINILTFAPRHAIASSALTSRDWYYAAKLVLYETLDLRTLQPKRVELLVTLLAYRHDLADLVRSLECHTWPDFFPPSSNLDGAHTAHPSFSPALTGVFTIAFQNMNSITSLVLPSFDHTFLRHHSAFGLKKFTILSHTMTSNEIIQLFAWLDGQANITHLAFPNLLDSNSIPFESLTIRKNSLSPKPTLTNYSNTYSASTPALVSLLSQSYPTSPFNSVNLLPVLTTLVATPSVVNHLTANRLVAISRPLQHVTLNINNTLYMGLRPLFLLTPLYGITTLVLKFSNTVDRRTVVKVLYAGAVLATPSATTSSSSETSDSVVASSSKALLQNLELVLSDLSIGIDQVSRNHCCIMSPVEANRSSIQVLQGNLRFYLSLSRPCEPQL
ncbi:hypothetical protein C0989_012685 [Termitomyces sp. Mn162]|nr:hypothetical protein C0989_012685 [Termitomyces sp. Mn162]